jgi:hypothetical protein
MIETAKLVEVGNHEQLINDETQVFSSAQIHPGVVLRQGDLMFAFVDRLPSTKKARLTRELVNGGDSGKHALLRGSLFDVDSAEAIAILSTQYPKLKISDNFYVGAAATLAENDEIVHDEHGNYQFIDCQGSSFITIRQKNLESGVETYVHD